LLAPGDPPLEATGFERNDGRLPWTGQLDLRFTKSIPSQDRVSALARRHQRHGPVHVVRVYQATGRRTMTAGSTPARDGGGRRGGRGSPAPTETASEIHRIRRTSNAAGGRLRFQ
jgi:hypothetical protein